MTQPAQSFHDGLVTEHYDVVFVGSGAGGGTLAHTLAPSGQRILLLERGDFLPRETDNRDPKPVNPALAAMANAIRAGEHLLGRMS